MTDTAAGEGVVTDTEWPDNALSQTIYDHFTEFEGLSPDEAGDSAGALLHALKLAGITYPLAAQLILKTAMQNGALSFTAAMLADALRPLVLACETADMMEELPDEVDGSLLDAANRALKAYDNATPAQPDTGVRDAIVKAIAFLKRDLDTDRINNTVESLLPDLVKADAITRGVKS